MEFLKQNVFITGGTRGIGEAIVREFAALGANVVFTFSKNIDKAKVLVEELQGLYPEQQFFAEQAEVRDAEKMKSVVEKYLEALEIFHVLVNNAGIVKDASLASMDSDSWLDVIDTNLNGVFNTTKPFVFEFMKNKKGNVINISSVAGVSGNKGQTNYSSSKAGMIGFTKSLSKEVAPFGVRVNAVAPGFIETDMTGDLSDRDMKEFKKKISLKRLGTAAEVAKVVSFLASGQSSYMTGQVLEVDGGLSL